MTSPTGKMPRRRCSGRCLDQEALDIARMGHFEFDVATQTFTFNDQYYAMIGTNAGDGGRVSHAGQQRSRNGSSTLKMPMSCRSPFRKQSRPPIPRSRAGQSRIIRRMVPSCGWMSGSGMRRILPEDGQVLWGQPGYHRTEHAEEALHESETKYRMLVENSNDIIYTISADGVLTFVSPRRDNPARLPDSGRDREVVPPVCPSGGYPGL